MSCENLTIEIKTGSEADFDMLYTDNATPPVAISLSGYSIVMSFIEAKTGDTLKRCTTEDGSIVITEVEGDAETTGTYSVFGGSTLGWQVGEMPVDIKYTLDGKSQHTVDFLLDITKGRSQ